MALPTARVAALSPMLGLCDAEQQEQIVSFLKKEETINESLNDTVVKKYDTDYDADETFKAKRIYSKVLTELT